MRVVCLHVGISEGLDEVKVTVGHVDGNSDGASVCTGEGIADESVVGKILEINEGSNEGSVEGSSVGVDDETVDGSIDGDDDEGFTVANRVGNIVGEGDELVEGLIVGRKLCDTDGITEGVQDGTLTGQ